MNNSRSTEKIASDLLLLLRDEIINKESSDILSETEKKVLRSLDPIEVNEEEIVTVLGQQGIWINKQEVNNWRGDVPISDYPINEDPNPEIVQKRVQETIEYVQELAVRYLKPPTPPVPGEIIITQEPDYKTGPAPPLILRQLAARPQTPEPKIIREAPPEAPKPIGPKRITISGKRLPPPPRKVVIERLAPLPTKPQNVIIERWLPYPDQRRRVIFNKAAEVKADIIKQRNVIIQWEAPAVNIRKEIRYLGVIRANPTDYIQKYGTTMKSSEALPQFVLDIATPSDIGVLAADYDYRSDLELDGEIEALQYVNLDAEGLTEYRSQLLQRGIRDLGASSASLSASIQESTHPSADSTQPRRSKSAQIEEAALQIFTIIDADNSGSISLEEAESIVLKLNSQLNRGYGEDEVRSFFMAVSGGTNASISKEQFLNVFAKLI